MNKIEILKSEIMKLTCIENLTIENRPNELIVCDDINNTFWMYITFKHTIATIRTLTIKHELRGNGLGTNIYKIFEKYLKSCGYKEIQLHLVLTSAEKFWTTNGFSVQNNIWQKTIT